MTELNPTEKYNTKLSQLAGLATAFASEIEGDTNLKKGEKFLLLQRFFADIEKVTKSFKKLEDEIKDFAKTNLYDTGDKQSNEIEYFGASVFVKYSYPKDKLDAEKLKSDLEKAFADTNTPFVEANYLTPSTVTQTVKIQSILDK
jgi:hypothetical protein